MKKPFFRLEDLKILPGSPQKALDFLKNEKYNRPVWKGWIAAWWHKKLVLFLFLNVFSVLFNLQNYGSYLFLIYLVVLGSQVFSDFWLVKLVSTLIYLFYVVFGFCWIPDHESRFFFFLFSVFLFRDVLDITVSFLYRFVSKGFLFFPWIEKRWDFKLFNLLMFFSTTGVIFAVPICFFIKLYIEYQLMALSSEPPQTVHFIDFLRYLASSK